MPAVVWVNKLNRRLSYCRVIQKANGSLSLQATLPHKTTPRTTQQQQIALWRKANDDDAAKQVRALAFRLDDELAEGTFEWRNWSKDHIKSASEDTETCLTFRDLCTGIEATFDEKYSAGQKNNRTVWGSKYKPAINWFRRLEGEASMESICTAIKCVEAPSTRKSIGTVVSVTLDHLGLQWDKAPLFDAAKGYTRSCLQEKDIPSDKELLDIWTSIKEPKWKWVHGMVMAFGIRPSESLDVWWKDDVLGVTTFKTKGLPFPRDAWALPDEWIEELDLRNMRMPKCNRLDVARQYSDYMERRKLKYFPLYNLRHAYAIRCLVQGVDVGLAARLMGHSEEMHRSHYQRWLNESHMKAVRLKNKEKFKRA